ncbi:MAG: MFS transporter [Xanthobacteraceae bacterium]
MAADSQRGTIGHLRNTVARYREAKRSLRTPTSWQSRYGLDWMNFFLADVQTGFGTFVAFYLAHLGWSKSSVGLALTVGTVAAVISLIPGGALADAVTWKRGLVVLGIAMIGGAAIILALVPAFVTVYLAEILHGCTAGIITPAIGAISLGLVGRRAMSARTGRNFRYAGGGHAVTSILMGVAGAYLADRAIFLVAAGLCVPTLIALGFIRPREIDHARARNASPDRQSSGIARITNLAQNRGLMIFTAAMMLFQLADASILPLIGESLSTAKTMGGSLWLSALIALPQIVVAVLSPWVGYHSEKWGRKPLLLIALIIEPIRAALLAISSTYSIYVAVEFLDGVNGSIINVMTVLVITDLTAGTGRFNVARGFVGAMLGVAAAISTLTTGYLFQGVSSLIGFLIVTGIAGSAVVVLWALLPETKPADYGE